MYDVMLPGTAMVVTSEEEFVSRFAFDVAFFVIIGTVLLNIVFGIILDSFGALRDETQSRQEYFETTCFICGLKSSAIDNAARQKGVPGWDHHTKYEHSMWNYMYFIFLVRNKKVVDYTGPEQAVRALMDK